MECSNELSAHLAMQHVDVAPLISADNLLQYSKFPLQCSYFITSSTGLLILAYNHNTILHLGNGLLIQSEP